MMSLIKCKMEKYKVKNYLTDLIVCRPFFTLQLRTFPEITTRVHSFVYFLPSLLQITYY